MKNIDKKYRNYFDSLELSLEKSDLIKKNIKDRYKKARRKNKIILSVITILLIGLISFGIVYADEIKGIVSGFTVYKTVKENGNEDFYGVTRAKKEMNYDADIPEIGSESHGVEYDIYDLENILDIKFLKSDIFKNNYVRVLNVKKENGKIAALNFDRGEFSCKNQMKQSVCLMKQYVSFSTKYSTKERSGLWTSGSGMGVEDYEIKSLGVIAQLVTWADDEDRPLNRDKIYMQWYRVFFVYDDVCYAFMFRVGYDKDIPRVERVKNFLEALYY